MFTKSPFIHLLLALAIIVCGVCLTAPAMVHAQATTPEPGDDQGSGERLAQLYQRALERLATQQKNLDRALSFADKTQAKIDTLKAEGTDTAALENALATFRSQVAAAQQTHDAAKSILDAHAGFDASGAVTDAEQARQTLQSAGDTIKQSAETLRQATQDLRQAMRAAGYDKAVDRLDYKALQKLIEKQGENLRKASEFGDKAETRIDELKAEGEDTAALETALGTYRSQLSDAQVAHDGAAAILDIHAGFSNDGKIIDETQATETVSSAEEAMQQARDGLKQARQTLADALKQYRQEHQPASQDGGGGEL